MKTKKNYRTLISALALNIISAIGNTIMFVTIHNKLSWINFGSAILSGIVLIFIFTHLDAYIREKHDGS